MWDDESDTATQSDRTDTPTESAGSATSAPSGRTTVRATVSSSVTDPEHCRLPVDVRTAVGVEPGQQIRLVVDGDPALFTVEQTERTVCQVNPTGRDRLGATAENFRVTVDATVVDPTLSVETAAEGGGFLERLSDSESSRLVAIAPHGGYIEYGTDEQARRLGDRLRTTTWYSAGWWPGGGAFSRWHITSTDIHPASFPALGDIADRGFDHAVSFHGWSESHIGVGGRAPRTLREDVRDAIDPVVDSEVRLATDDSYDGDSPDNIVNWLTASGDDGVQLEQPRSVRENAATEVADAVADVFEQRL